VNGDRTDDRLAGAAATARKLIGRVADALDSGDQADADSALLRTAEEILARLSQPSPADPPAAVDNASDIVLDVSDLLGYFEHNRLPTGIQRVQTELIFNIMKSTHGRPVQLCCFVETRRQWVVVDSDMFVDVCIQSRIGGDTGEPRWVAAIRDLHAAIGASPALVFARGAALVNVGTSWWLPNYFLYVRAAKIASDLRYIPLIYDLIPALTPENCGAGLVQEFIGWFLGVLDHADFYLAISDATRNDVLAFATKLGRPIDPDRVAVARLDADFRAAEARALPEGRRIIEPFVLFVSTLEARKNQIGALDAWALLIARHGADKIPRLLLVGKRGFKCEAIFDRLESNADLRERVTILSGIEDVELQTLYRDCMFTIYPSFYEGWGLPVTEALCYGKVALVAENSSLPEAGGSSALYFKTGSTVAMTSALEPLIFDPEHLRRQEAVVARNFRPRRWADIAGEVVDKIRCWAADTPLPRWQPPLVQPDAYYSLVRNTSVTIRPGMRSAELFRSGSGWHKLEDHGCWTIPTGAELELRQTARSIRRIGLELLQPGHAVMLYRAEIVGHDINTTGKFEAESAKWAFLDIPDGVEDEVVRVRITTTILFEANADWNGDSRQLGVGVKGFYVFGDGSASRIDFIEAAALGALSDFDIYRNGA
jgi:glycosyltransferase involved in cell wall biosynthesis